MQESKALPGVDTAANGGLAVALSSANGAGGDASVGADGATVVARSESRRGARIAREP